MAKAPDLRKSDHAYISGFHEFLDFGARISLSPFLEISKHNSRTFHTLKASHFDF